jgi:hypothetical protein
MADNIVARLRERLARASIGDRMYERPMDWTEADTLLAEIERLRAALKEIASGDLDDWMMVATANHTFKEENTDD